MRRHFDTPRARQRAIEGCYADAVHIQRHDATLLITDADAIRR